MSPRSRALLAGPKLKLIGLTVLLLCGFIRGERIAAAPAHHQAPSVIHDFIVSLTPTTLRVDSYLRISPELVPEVYRKIDTDNDGKTSPAERDAWIRNHAAKLGVSLDGVPVQLQIGAIPELSREDLLLSIGHPLVVAYQASFTTPLEGKHRIQIIYGDSYLSYDEYYVSIAGDLTGDTASRNVTRPHYPATYQIIYLIPPAGRSVPAAQGKLAPAPYTAPAAQPAAPSQTTVGIAPLSTQGAFVVPSTAVPQVTSGQVAAPGSSSAAATGSTSQAVRVLDMLRRWHGELWQALAMLLLALGIGALHALTPGHGKAVVAAYLIGSRGRVRDATLLGGIITLTHTSGVILLGVVLLLVSNFSMPRALQPALELISGLLVLVLGIYLLIQRWWQLRTPGTADSPVAMHEHEAHSHDAHDHSHGLHAHDYPEGHVHEHMHTHSHGGHSHTHIYPAGSTSVRALIGLGISGGLVPCPDALAILLLAVGVGQIGLGLGLVLSFSVGLAAVLIGLGVALVKMKGALERSGRVGLSTNPLWTRWVPLASAAVVVVVGILMVSASLAGRWS